MVGAPLGSDRHEWAVRSLVAHGWLIPLPVRGTYEFLSAQSVPDRAGDPLTEAAAALKRDPGLRLQLVLGGAAFLGGFNERAPLRYTLIVPRQAPIQRGLAHAYDLIRAAPSRFFGAAPPDSVTMSGASRLLFDAALWPTRAGDLRGPDHWLRAALATAEIAEILAFAQRLDSDRVTARAGYFAEAFGRSDIAASLADLHPKAAVRLGDPAGPLHARDTRFGVRDHLGSPAHDLRASHHSAVGTLRWTRGAPALPRVRPGALPRLDGDRGPVRWRPSCDLQGRHCTPEVQARTCRRFSTDLDFAAESTDYPEHVLDSLEEDFSFEGVTFHLTALVDYLGLNYYRRDSVSARSDRAFDWEIGAVPGSGQTQMGWHVASDGLRDVLLELNQTYAPPEIVVTVNGAAYPDTVEQDGRVRDVGRLDYLARHVAAAADSLRAGVPLTGPTSGQFSTTMSGALATPGGSVWSTSTSPASAAR